MVQLTGIEPVRCCHRGILSPLRLPVPPQLLNSIIITHLFLIVNIFSAQKISGSALQNFEIINLILVEKAAPIWYNYCRAPLLFHKLEADYPCNGQKPADDALA